MSDHQIVIKLKPEQLQELRRLAQAAGAESLNSFLKQQLFTALSGSLSEPKFEIDDGTNWQSITGQIRRLHRELQTFIAESANSGIEGDVEEDDDDTRSSAVGAEPLFNDAVPVLLESDPGDRHASSLPPPARQTTFDAGTDKLEQLADRAFAISPRLGALEGESQDPLGDLLEDSLLNREDEEELEDEFEEEFKEEDDAESPFFEEVTDARELEEMQEEPLSEPDVSVQTSPATAVNTPALDDTSDNNVDTSTQTGTDTSYESDPSNPPISGGPPPRRRRT